ncbi:MAG: pseudouridine synthase [Myxococcota bacterium]
MSAEERLQKILAQAGIASRRAAEQLIVDGRVRVNGEVVNTLGAKANPEQDTIEVDGHGTLEREPIVYMLMNKPPQVVTTAADPEGRHTVIDVLDMSRAQGKRQFEGDMPRVYPVGRLDFDAEGALLITNDGTLTNQLLHPRHHVPKTYLVKLRGRPEAKQLDRLRRGVRLKEADGKLSRSTKPSQVVVVKESPANTWIELTIFEGRHHQVKRMCEAIGHGVLRLVRTEFAGVRLDDLPTGAWRYLTKSEVATLRGWGDGTLTATLPPPSEPARGARDKARSEPAAKGARKSQGRSSGESRKGQRGGAGGKAAGAGRSKAAPSARKSRGPKKGKGSKTRGQRR